MKTLTSLMTVLTALFLAQAEAKTIIKIDGSSTVYPITEAVAEEFLKQKAHTLVGEVKYVPLPPQAYSMALGNFQKSKPGTVFSGKSEVGLKIEDLLKNVTPFLGMGQGGHNVAGDVGMGLLKGMKAGEVLRRESCLILAFNGGDDFPALFQNQVHLGPVTELPGAGARQDETRQHF